MNKLIPALAFGLVLSAPARSQVLNSAEMLGVGGTMTLRPYTAFSVIDTMIQGANATWDFSALTTASGMTNLNVTIANPASTPYGANFPTANYAYVESPTTAYRYFNRTAQKMERVGSFSGGVLKTYSDAQVEYVFPLQLGTTNADTWNNDQSFDGGDYNFTCVGAGTLILPNEQWDDVIMVRAYIQEGGLYEFNSYFWYSAATGAILVQYVPGDGFFVGEFGYYEVGTQSGVADVPAMEFLTWNNPVTDELRLGTRAANAGTTDWRVLNTAGQVMRSGTTRASGGAIDRWTVDVQALPSGMYVLAMGDGTSASALRFVKQ